jgi:hypothetical protein
MNARLINGRKSLYVGAGQYAKPEIDYQRMASTRSLADRKFVRFFLLPVCGLLICGLMVAIANGNIKLRCCNEQLRVEKAYLQTRVGLLERQWHRETSRDIITSRANLELGLHAPETPATIIVYNSTETGRRGVVTR